MRPYETMLLIDGRLPDAGIDAAVERFSALVAENGGSMTNVDRWGRRRLAYEIEDMQEGYYVVFTYDLPPDGQKPIEAALPFVEGLVRHKTVRPEVRVRNAS